MFYKKNQIERDNLRKMSKTQLETVMDNFNPRKVARLKDAQAYSNVVNLISHDSEYLLLTITSTAVDVNLRQYSQKQSTIYIPTTKMTSLGVEFECMYVYDVLKDHFRDIKQISEHKKSYQNVLLNILYAFKINVDWSKTKGRFFDEKFSELEQRVVDQKVVYLEGLVKDLW